MLEVQGGLEAHVQPPSSTCPSRCRAAQLSLHTRGPAGVWAGMTVPLSGFFLLLLGLVDSHLPPG